MHSDLSKCVVLGALLFGTSRFLLFTLDLGNLQLLLVITN